MPSNNGLVFMGFFFLLFGGGGPLNESGQLIVGHFVACSDHWALIGPGKTIADMRTMVEVACACDWENAMFMCHVIGRMELR